MRQIKRTSRSWAASLLVAGYVLCLLASSVLAVGNAPAGSHSLDPQHHHAKDSHAVDSHAKAAGHSHDPTGSYDHAGGAAPHEHPAPHHDEPQSSTCCGLACLSALPANMPCFESRPVLASSLLAGMPQDSIAGRVPPLLYRPPISL